MGTYELLVSTFVLYQMRWIHDHLISNQNYLLWSLPFQPEKNRF